MTLLVDLTYPASWQSLPLSLLARRCWHDAMAGRLDGRAHWLSLADARGSALVGLPAVLVTDPHAYGYGNLRTLVADAGSPFATPAVRAALHRLPPVPPADLLPNLIITHPGYATFPVGPGRADRDALRRLLAETVGWAGAAGASAVALPYTEAGGPLATAAAEAGFRAIPLTSDAYLDVPPGGFGEYLSRQSAHRRRRLAAERRHLARSGLHVRLVASIDAELLGRMAQLRARHRAKYGLPADVGAERRRLGRLIRSLGSLASAVVVEGAGGHPVCFALQALDGDTWHEVCCGTDYDDPRSRYAYFEATCYTPVEAAAERGIRRISFGVGAEEAKLRRGARLVPLTCLTLGLTPAAVAALDAVATAWAPADRLAGGPADGSAGLTAGGPADGGRAP